MGDALPRYQEHGTVTSGETARQLLGTPGRLATLALTIALVTLGPKRFWLVACGLGEDTNLALYPRAPRQLLRWRWLVFTLVILLPATVWGGEATGHVGGIPLSCDGFLAAIRMLARALVVMAAVNGFAGAYGYRRSGLVFRAGRPERPRLLAWHCHEPAAGAGALKPDRLAQPSYARRPPRRMVAGLRLLLVTILANALKRGEEIALAAEARAFAPDKIRATPAGAGRVDLCLAFVLLVTLVAVFFLDW